MHDHHQQLHARLRAALDDEHPGDDAIDILLELADDHRRHGGCSSHDDRGARDNGYVFADVVDISPDLDPAVAYFISRPADPHDDRANLA